MKRMKLAGALIVASLVVSAAKVRPADVNRLTDEEKQQGWRLLFNGVDFTGWMTLAGDSLREGMWQVQDGALTVLGGHEQGCDIITRDTFVNFELTLEVKLTRGANSGIKYFIQPACSVGFEYQVLDDEVNPDAKLGRNGNRRFASLYDLLPAKNTTPKPIGEWNQVRLVVQGNHIEHWLNGKKVLEFDRDSKKFRQAFEKSKFRAVKDFCSRRQGHLFLQDHGRQVSYRNIKLRVL
ncbi:MAG TPA: DUF1080 domain-containing protein [bacterium]|nr:DUF1080 domain-containing protein [bacterium]HPN35717.1 DUF1080 domain-containing protein [bacterium]